MRPSLRSLSTLLVAALALVVVAPAAFAADILVVVDSSGSMASKTKDGQVKLEAARRTLAELAPQLADHRTALMLFGHRKAPSDAGSCSDIEIVAPFKADGAAAFASGLQSLKARGRTPLDRALRTALSALLKLEADTQKIVIVLTDGNETCGGNPVEAAAALRAAGIDVQLHVVGFALRAGEDKQLRAMAEAGGGRYVGADDAAALAQAMPQIVRTALVSTKETITGRETLLDESFDGEDFGETWEILRPDLDRVAVSDGSAFLLTQYTAPWPDKMEEIKNVVVTKQPLKALDVDIETEFKFQMAAQYQTAGILLYQDDRNYVALSAYANPHGYNIDRLVMFTRVVDGQASYRYTSLGHGKEAEYRTFPFKLVRRGVFIQGLHRVLDKKTGESKWVEIGRTAVPSMRALKVGLMACNARGKVYGGGAIPEADAQFDYVRATAPTIERTRRSLDMEGSIYATEFLDAEQFAADFEMRNAVPTEAGIERGLHVVTRHGNYSKEKPVQNLALLDRELPAGDWTVEVQARGRLTSQGLRFGIVLYQDDDNWLEFGHDTHGRGGYGHNPSFVLEKATRGETKRQVVNATRNAELDSDPYIFRFVKKGPRVTASVYAWNAAEKKLTWHEIGSQTMLRFKGRLGLIARNTYAKVYGGGATHQVPVLFESLVIRK